MVVNHDCLKCIISVFVYSDKAELSIQELVQNEAVGKYSTEELKFHLNRLSDEKWIVSNRTTRPYEMLDPQSPSWSVHDWRMSESASQYWEAVNRIAIWEEFKSKTAGESLKFSLELLKGYSKSWIESKLNESEI
ncbi:DUF2513 domain-containing protein [Vibrio splendidus]|uniref:DUF2513 domain-containing protein n=1 Tax=Enterovibrio norvegicus TaxID=188144 RepID=A0A2N7L841_9GAMM|nr:MULTISPECIES: DUF2513 domain-containing protein [Vibrionaceae]PMN90290.1 DUF2513 domain-containing protein [Enterovibrio norvegicus]PTO56857.1 DUF2513 domain-containing protein [Vibrio splendidus]